MMEPSNLSPLLLINWKTKGVVVVVCGGVLHTFVVFGSFVVVVVGFVFVLHTSVVFVVDGFVVRL